MALTVFLAMLQSTLEAVFGNMTIVALGIMLVLLVGFLLLNIDFRFAVMFVSPLTLAFVKLTWFPGWVGLVFWIFVVMFGGYLAWSAIAERF
jgi:hypothetical protein